MTVTPLMRKPLAEAYKLGRIMGRNDRVAGRTVGVCPFLLEADSWAHRRLAVAWHRGYREMQPPAAPSPEDRAEGALGIGDTPPVPQFGNFSAEGVRHG